jgi:hypothetical protein
VKKNHLFTSQINGFGNCEKVSVGELVLRTEYGCRSKKVYHEAKDVRQGQDPL